MSNYVEGGLAEFAPPPYQFTNLISATFILRTKNGKTDLQNVCDKFLNGPLNRTDPKEIFEPAIDKVLVICSRFPVSEAPSVPVGYSRYREIAIMFSVYDRKKDEWSWYVPGLYLDGPPVGDEEWQAALPISIGRELYGLSKRRAEIDFDTDDYSACLRTITIASPGTPIDVAKVLEISLKSAHDSLMLDASLADAETELLECGVNPPEPHSFRGSQETEEIRADRDGARESLCQARRRLARIRTLPVAEPLPGGDPALPPGQDPKPLSRRELMVMLWSDDPYGGVAANQPAPVGEELLEKLGLVQGEYCAPDSSFASSSSSVVSSSSTPSQSQFQFDFRLVGLRQFHDPENYQLAAYQRVIRTQILFDRLPWGPLQLYHAEIDTGSDIATLLGLESQDLNVDQVYAYKPANAKFGDQVGQMP